MLSTSLEITKPQPKSIDFANLIVESMQHFIKVVFDSFWEVLTSKVE